jgi:hypothetical protein
MRKCREKGTGLLLFSKTEFNTKIKNLELSITIKIAVIVTKGIGILGMMIKM